MADGKIYLSAAGAFHLAVLLIRLEWAIGPISVRAQLAGFIEPLRFYEDVHGFEDIGKEATGWHNSISNNVLPLILDTEKNSLRAAKTRWESLVSERLGEHYLLRAQSNLDHKKLNQGAIGFLPEDEYAFLDVMEVSDLSDACVCLMLGRATPAEYMALRSAEGLLRRWYEHKTGKQIMKAWGRVLERLVKEYPEATRPKELAVLAYLKVRRDEVAHPERVSTMIEAEATLMTVFSLAADLKGIFSMLPLVQIDENLSLGLEPGTRPPRA